jgi:hypothetical protein
MKYLLFISILCIAMSCSNKIITVSVSTKVKNPKDTITYVPVSTLSITGDFDGDGKQDFLNQFLADSTGSRVDKIPAFENETWEEIVDYYSRSGYYTALCVKQIPTDTLSFGFSQGLYCLINVGDLNNDRRDEIAIVPDKVDFSRHNYCYIYTLCNATWKNLFVFSVHEGAFDFAGGETPPTFTNIPEVLEYRKNEWHYYDYLDLEYENEEQVGQMKPLKVSNCY